MKPLFIALSILFSNLASVPPTAADPTLCKGHEPTITGTAGDDVLYGTANRDIIIANAGNDTIYAGPGQDIICAGPGQDIIYGGDDADWITGGSGFDLMNGGQGIDFTGSIGWCTQTHYAPKCTEPVDMTPPPAHAPGWVDSGNGVSIPAIGLRIRQCESGGNYQAQNPTSTASGAFQWIDGSWRAYGFVERYGVTRAMYATPAQQDESFVIGYQRSGTTPWNASIHCWG